jgi:hypothetical protein
VPAGTGTGNSVGVIHALMSGCRRRTLSPLATSDAFRRHVEDLSSSACGGGAGRRFVGWRLRGRGDRLEDQLGDLTGVGVQRVRSLEEGNPMLGTRGVRLGLSDPEIYEMQVRAIFRATVTVRERTGRAPHLEIMIPTWTPLRGTTVAGVGADAGGAAVAQSGGCSRGPEAGYARQGWHQWLWPYRPRDLSLRPSARRRNRVGRHQRRDGYRDVAHLLRHDSVYGPFPRSVEVLDGALRVDGREIPCSPRPTRSRCRGARSVPRS